MAIDNQLLVSSVILMSLIEILYFATIHFVTICDYVFSLIILVTINYLLDFLSYFVTTLQLLEASFFHVDNVYVYQK